MTISVFKNFRCRNIVINIVPKFNIVSYKVTNGFKTVKFILFFPTASFFPLVILFSTCYTQFPNAKFEFIIAMLSAVILQKFDPGLAGHVKPPDRLTRQKQRTVLPQTVPRFDIRHGLPPRRVFPVFAIASINSLRLSSFLCSDGVSPAFDGAS